MEIRDYVRARARRFGLAAMLALVAAAVAWVAVRDQPPLYVASTRLAVPPSGGQSIGAIGLYVADFEQAIRSSEVTSTVAEETGVSAAEYRAGIGAQRVGQASLIQVQFSGQDRETAEAVVQVAAATTLEALAQPKLFTAQQVATAAQRDFEQAQAEMDALIERTGILFPTDRYRQRLNSVESLELRLREAEALGDTVLADVLSDRIAVEQENLAEARTAVEEYLPLRDNLNAATAARNDARQRLTEANLSYQQATSPRLIEPVSVDARSRTQMIIQAVGVAAVVAFMLGMGLVVLLDVSRAGSAQAARRPSITTR